MLHHQYFHIISWAHLGSRISPRGSLPFQHRLDIKNGGAINGVESFDFYREAFGFDNAAGREADPGGPHPSAFAKIPT